MPTDKLKELTKSCAGRQSQPRHQVKLSGRGHIPATGPEAKENTETGPKGSVNYLTDKQVMGEWVDKGRFLRKMGDPMKYFRKTSGYLIVEDCFSMSHYPGE